MTKKVERNYLEIFSIQDLRINHDIELDNTITLLEPSDFQINKFFYKNVGKNHRWIDRLSWDNLKWASYLDNNNVLTYVLKLNDELIGYFETIQDLPNKSSEIAYFGILKDFIGNKFGGYLLSEAIKKCFELNCNKVWVHTCTLDHEHALKNYIDRGMKIFKQETINLI